MGSGDGTRAGSSVGTAVGRAVGESEGLALGSLVGRGVGCAVGKGVGCAVGSGVGSGGPSVGVCVGMLGAIVGAQEYASAQQRALYVAEICGGVRLQRV